MRKKLLRKGIILFKSCQMLHVPSCFLLFFLVSLFLSRHQIPMVQSAFYAIPFSFAAMGCFAINDVYDYDKDVINKPYRILPMGLITRQRAFQTGCFLFFLSAIGAIGVSQNTYELFLYFFAIILAFIYGRFINYLSKSKSVYTAIVIAIPLFFVVYKSSMEIDSFSLLLAVILYITGKELMMDIYDMEGDKESGQYTIPVQWGEKRTFILAAIVQIVSLALFKVRLEVAAHIIVLCFSYLGICYYIWLNKDRIWRRFVVYCLWLPLVICLIVVM